MRTIFAGSILLIWAVISMAAKEASAAEIKWVGDSLCQVSLSGPIEKDDGDALRAFLDSRELLIDPSFVRFEQDALRLCLNSPGGALTGGIGLGRVIHEQGIGTVIPKDAICLSACTLPFMMGTIFLSDEFREIDRKMHPTARLGFHQPDLDINSGTFSSDQLRKAYNLSVVSIAEALTLYTTATELRGRPYGQADLLHNMLKHVGQDFFYIDSVAKALRWDVDVYDLPPPNGVTGIEATYACWNMFEANNNYIPSVSERNFEDSFSWPYHYVDSPWETELTLEDGLAFYRIGSAGGVVTQSGCYFASSLETEYLDISEIPRLYGCFFGRGAMQFPSGGWCANPDDHYDFLDGLIYVPTFAMFPPSTRLTELPRLAKAAASKARVSRQTLPADASWRQIVNVASDDVLWVRSCGSSKCKKVGSLAPNQRGFYTTDCKGKWCRVHDKTGQELGWSHSGYMKTVSSP